MPGFSLASGSSDKESKPEALAATAKHPFVQDFSFALSSAVHFLLTQASQTQYGCRWRGRVG